MTVVGEHRGIPDWPTVTIGLGNGMSIGLMQTDATTIYCVINGPNANPPFSLINCAASPDCLTLTSQTKWWFVWINVSVVIDPTALTLTINDGETPMVQQISAGDLTAVRDFIGACHLPPIPKEFRLGR